MADELVYTTVGISYKVLNVRIRPPLKEKGDQFYITDGFVKRSLSNLDTDSPARSLSKQGKVKERQTGGNIDKGVHVR